jgi:ATP-binding cassette subfamily C protein
MTAVPELLPIATVKQTRSYVWARLRGRRVLGLSAAALFIAAGLAGIVAPRVLGQLADDVGAGRDTVVVVALLIAVGAVAGALFDGLAVVVLARVGEPALADLRERALSRALHLPAGRLERATTGDLLSRLADDVRTASDGLKIVVPVIASAGVAIVFTTAGVLVLDWRLGLAMLVSLPVCVLALRWYLPRARELYREQRVAHGERAEALLTGVSSASTARAFGVGPLLLRRVDEASTRSADVSVAAYRASLQFLNRYNFAEFLGLAAVLCTGFLVVRGQGATVGAVTAAALYFMRLFGPVGGLLFTFDSFMSMGAALSRLVGIALLPPPPARGAGPEEVTGEVALVGVGHEYVAGKPVLRGIALRLHPGERVALVGATGAGKTTLGAIAAGLLRPSTGSVLANGRPLDTAVPASRAGMFLVAQESHAFAGTVRDFLTLVRPHADDEAVVEALAATSADRWVAALPDGLDTVIGDAGHQLTPSQLQHLALTRVVLGDPWFVVLDEATAEAGSAGARVLEQAAEAATAGRTALVVAHRLTQARSADRILVMHDGEIAEEGTHEDLLALGGRYAELWSAWRGSRIG